MRESENWTTVIGGRPGWIDLDLPHLWRYRDLIRLLVWRDFVTQYKQTILGPAWFVLTPLATSGVFTVIFAVIAKIPTDGVPPFLFYMAGNTCWGYFAACLTQTSSTFLANMSLFGKVYFPRIVVPLAALISNVFKFLVQFALFIVILLYFRLGGYGVHPQTGILYVPLLVVQMAALSLGCGLIVSAVTAKYRDLNYGMVFGTQLWMYATPIIYPLSQVPEAYRGIVALNPMTTVVEGFRWAFLGTATLTTGHILLGVIVTAGILLVGLVTFSRVEKTFVDTV
jgi:lipopolysaccharide transport system permease protein